MQVRTCGISRFSNPGDDFALFDHYLFLHQILLVVGLDGKEITLVLDDDEIPISAHVIIAVDHLTAIRCPDRGAYRRRDIYPIVTSRTSHAELDRDGPLNRPHELSFFVSHDCGVFSCSDIFDIDIHLQDLGGSGDEDPLSHLDRTRIPDAVDPGNLIHLNPVGLTDPPKV
jgi:hypothetical protein